MSYCRWSSDNWRSDVYVYECTDGTWTTHVAGRKRVGELPEPPGYEPPFDEDFLRRHREYQAAVSAAEMVPIGLPHDGKTFKDGSPAECWGTLVMLKTAGYHVPQYALDELYEEAQEPAAERDMEAGR